MLIFSAQSRQVVDEAVASLPDPSQRTVWRAWAEQHPRVRRPGDPADDGSGPLPAEVTDVVLGALKQAADSMQRQLDSGGVPEDDVYILDNDLSLISSIVRSVHQNMGLHKA